MNIRTTCLAAALLLSVTSLVSTAADPVEPSKISGYLGGYRGSIVFTGTPLAGTRASFTGNRNKEIGTLRMVTTDPGSGFTISEVVAIRNNRVNYSISTGFGGFGGGRGTARISKNVLRYTVPLTIGGSGYVLQGVTRKSNRRLSVTHTFTGAMPAVISYSLSKIGN